MTKTATIDTVSKLLWKRAVIRCAAGSAGLADVALLQLLCQRIKLMDKADKSPRQSHPG
jgi:hypothetical protein